MLVESSNQRPRSILWTAVISDCLSMVPRLWKQTGQIAPMRLRCPLDW